MKRYNVCFYGANYRIAQIIQKSLPVNRVICELRSANQDLVDFCFVKHIALHFVESKDHLASIDVTNSQLGVSYGFGLIFTQELIKRHERGIINIHPGKLPEYRGRHPIAFAFLNNDWEIGVTLHLIDENIDQGFLLAKATIDRDLYDTHLEINKKVENLLDLGLFHQAIDMLDQDLKEPIEGGVYHQSMQKRSLTVRSEAMASRELFNLMRSQSPYGGVEVNGKRYTQCHAVADRLGYQEFDFVTCADGIILALK